MWGKNIYNLLYFILFLAIIKKITTMKHKPLLLIVFLIFFTNKALSNIVVEKTESDTSGFHYLHGKIDLGKAEFTVPQGFNFIDAKNSRFVLEQLWGNPPDSSILGMLFLEAKSPLDTDVWAYAITYDDLGFVKDDDADDINYDDLLKEIKKDFETANVERIKAGYPTVSLIGWASKPYYDKEKKALHWAKEIKFSDSKTSTLNYDIRLLGRKGVLVFQAIGHKNQVAEVKSITNTVIDNVSFKSGEKYSDFNPDVDEIAAYTIGGLVAGKVLAKVGLLAVFLKYIKIIIIAVVAAGGAIWRYISGRKNKVE